MKKFLRNGAIALTVGACCASALTGFSFSNGAVADAAEVVRQNAPAQRYTLKSADPASGTKVKQLMTIVTTWEIPEDGFQMMVNDIDQNLIKVRDAGGRLIKTGALELDQLKGEVSIWINGNITKEGIYTVIIPAGAIYDSELPSLACEETKLVYTIGNPSTEQQPVTINTFTPAEDDIINILSVISTTWNDPATGDGLAVSDDPQAVEVINDADNSLVSYASLTLTDGVVDINIANPVTTPGDYTVVIKPDMVYDAQDGIMIPKSGNKEVKLKYSVELPRCTFTAADPADKSKVLGPLTSIMTTWSDPSEDQSLTVSTDPQAVEIRNDADNELISYGTLEKTADGVKVNVTTAFEVLDEVHYTVTIKAGMVYDVDAQDNIIAHTVNREVKLSYTLVPARCDLFSADPADGEKVEELKEITTKWYSPNIGSGLFCSVKNDCVEVLDAEDNVVTTGKMRISGSTTIKITLNETVNKPGEYKVIIKPNTVYNYTIGENNSMVIYEETYNEQVELNYTVDIVRCSLAEVDPADHSTVNELRVINTKWNDPGLGRGMAVSDDINKIVVRDSEAAPVSNGKLELVGENGEVRITLTDPVTTKGSYTVTIFPNSVYDMLDFTTIMEETGNKGTVLFYDVDPELDSVEGIEADGTGIVYENGVVTVNGMENPVITVYGMGGTAVAKVAASTLEVADLVPGVYVVNAVDNGRVLTGKIIVK